MLINDLAKNIKTNNVLHFYTTQAKVKDNVWLQNMQVI